MKRTAHPTIEPLESRIAPAVFIVTNLNDSGSGSLRAELAASDAHGGSNTIVFHLPAHPLHGENIIALASGALTTMGNVTITGPGAGKLIVSGEASSGVFNITGQTGLTTISGLSIVDGSNDDAGGGIYCEQSLTLKNVVISGNYATSGGGVDVSGSAGAKVSISNSLISGNGAEIDGGLDLDGGSLTFSNTVVTANRATDGAGGMFAGIDGSGSGIAFTGCRISGNSGPYGGLFLAGDDSAKITISGTTISGNISTSTSTVGGGGLYFKYGNAAIIHSTIVNNTAVYAGGGIEASTFTSLTISGSTISGNQTTKLKAAYQGGGGVFLYGAGNSPVASVKILSSVITDNHSAGPGGGVYAVNGANLTISGTTISGNGAASGGGIQTSGMSQIDAVNLTVIGGKISDNTGAVGGGGIDAASVYGTISITGAKISGNFCGGVGGGISAYSTVSVTIKNVVVSGNIATGSGGGMQISATPVFHVSGGSFTGNESGGSGGGIYASDSTGSIIGVTISGNAATTAGGGVGAAAGTVTIQASKVTGNSAPASADLFFTDGGAFTYV